MERPPAKAQVLELDDDHVFIFYHPRKSIIDYLETVWKKVDARVTDIISFRTMLYQFYYEIWRERNDPSALKMAMERISAELEGNVNMEACTIFEKYFKDLYIHPVLFCAIDTYIKVNPLDDESIPKILAAVKAITSMQTLDTLEYRCIRYVYHQVIADLSVRKAQRDNSKKI
jgi:hypothetical protein